jgi:large subunit ribosomal protein L9
MEVILTRPVVKLGDRGAIVRVADGYARNYLLPHGIAIAATKGARRQAEDMARAEQRREDRRRDAAGLERDRVAGKNITVRARSTSAGKLYGSVSARDICESLRQTHGVTVDPSTCTMDEHSIREVGTYTVAFRIYKDIDAAIQVTVKGIEDETAAPAEEAAERSAPKPKPIITGGAVDDRG